MEARDAARALEKAIDDPQKPITVADASAKSGLPLRDVERGLNWLTSEYRGHLRVTEEGQLVFLYPYGFTKPWETRDAIANAFRAAGKVLVGVGRFVVRAWLTVVIFAYAAIFLAILIGLTFARQGNSNSRESSVPSALGYVFFRVLADALFWTFHPFSPIAIGAQNRWDVYDDRRDFRSARAPKDETPLYEKVNRFVFGPTPVPDDPQAMQKRVIAEIRAQKGRIGLGDVMRVTGLPREEADPLMARLMLDYEGDVDVSEGGGITYRFEALRKTALDTTAPRPAPAWATKETLPPLTGNQPGSNVLVGFLNGFNLLMGFYAIGANLTIDRLLYIFQTSGRHAIPLPPMPYDGVPIALGLVPLLFSIAVFLLPIGRALLRPIKAREVAKENGRLGLLREIMARIEKRAPLDEPSLAKAWTQAAGEEPAPKELTRAIVELGGDADITENGEVRYRFVDLETEAEALEEERAAAPEAEAKIGKVIFGSDR